MLPSKACTSFLTLQTNRGGTYNQKVGVSTSYCKKGGVAYFLRVKLASIYIPNLAYGLKLCVERHNRMQKGPRIVPFSPALLGEELRRRRGSYSMSIGAALWYSCRSFVLQWLTYSLLRYEVVLDY